ncbi:MAG: sensor histidine kinase [Anaerolineae bacterium]
MDKVVRQGWSEWSMARYRQVEQCMPILADISRADLLLYGSHSEPGYVVILAQARPHSVPPIYPEPLVGQTVKLVNKPAIHQALVRGRPGRDSHGLIDEGAPIVQEVLPVRDDDGQLVAALSIEKTLIEHERHNRRDSAFRQAIRQCQEMVLRGELRGVELLTPFGEHDGILVVDAMGIVKYASGVANNLYRRLGYMETLPGKYLADLGTADARFFSKVLKGGRCLQEEVQEGDRIWIKKAIPLRAPTNGHRWQRRLLPFLFSQPESRVVGVILTIHDATDAQRKARERKVQAAMIQEIHHRVKNNLQIIASLLRMQARRLESGEARRVIEEGINRILSVAVVHEFLSNPESQIINIKDVSQRIIKQMVQGVIDPRKEIELKLEGPNIYLPPQQATACALVINELLQNALQHGYERRRGGTIEVSLEDESDMVRIQISDDGRGLPADFELEQSAAMGLHIVRTLVEDDLRGEFELVDRGGVSATVTFPKRPLRGSRL